VPTQQVAAEPHANDEHDHRGRPDTSRTQLARSRPCASIDRFLALGSSPGVARRFAHIHPSLLAGRQPLLAHSAAIASAESATPPGGSPLRRSVRRFQVKHCPWSGLMHGCAYLNAAGTEAIRPDSAP
jgi:hypothetical protein